MGKLDLGLVVGPKGDKGDSVTGVRKKTGTHAPGTTDTYELTLDNGETASGTFEVYNGRDGVNGADGIKGDMGPAGPAGPAGVNATINGQTAVSIEAGDNVDIQTEAGKVTVSAKVSKSWTVQLTVAGWAAGTNNFAGIYARYKQEVSCEGMTADTDITSIQFAGGDFSACASYQWYLRPGAGVCTFWSPGKPYADFTVKLTAVRE